MELKKFPEGEEERGVEQEVVYKEKGAADIEAAYKKWFKKFPPQRFKLAITSLILVDNKCLNNTYFFKTKNL